MNNNLPAPAETFLRAAIQSGVRVSLQAIGAALVTRGLVTQGQVDGILPTLLESIGGSLLFAAGVALSQLNAWIGHSRYASTWNALQAMLLQSAQNVQDPEKPAEADKPTIAPVPAEPVALAPSAAPIAVTEAAPAAQDAPPPAYAHTDANFQGANA